MAVYKKPLYDKDGNQIYPDVGLELDEVIYGDDPGQAETPSPWIETGDIKDGQITSNLLKGWSTANTTDEWVPVATSSRELQHRLIKPFNADGTIPTTAIADGAVTNAKIDWSTTARPIYYRGQDWATSWTFSYNVFNPQLIFVAWQNAIAMFVRIYDQIYKVFQTTSATVTASINTTNHTWTLSTSNTGVVNVLELRNTKTGG